MANRLEKIPGSRVTSFFCSGKVQLRYLQYLVKKEPFLPINPNVIEVITRSPRIFTEKLLRLLDFQTCTTSCHPSLHFASYGGKSKIPKDHLKCAEHLSLASPSARAQGEFTHHGLLLSDREPPWPLIVAVPFVNNGRRSL